MLNFLCPEYFRYKQTSSKFAGNKNNETDHQKKDLESFSERLFMETSKYNFNKSFILNTSFAMISFLFVIFTANIIQKKISANIFPAFCAKFSSKSFYQKLSQIPVFAVTNSSGQPYLTNNIKGEQVGLIFFSHEDALVLLRTMQKARQVFDARIYVMGLDKAYKMVLSHATPSGIKSNQGQELKMIFRFYPNQKQVRYAKSIVNRLNVVEKFRGIPVFIAEGLTIRKGCEDIIPIFLTKEDLAEAWIKLSLHNPDLKTTPTIVVGDLFKIIKKMENLKTEYSNFGFFPPKESIEFVKKESKTNPSAKIFPGNFQKI
nr:translocator of the inner chloroplast membrane [Cryptomonas sp.]